MILKDLHVHTDFSDGLCSHEEVVLSAIAGGVTTLGFSDHSFTAYDTSYCMQAERYGEYRREVARLKEKYAGQIEILCGIEQDFYSAFPAEGFDYVIGSVHAIRCGQEYPAVDCSLPVTKQTIRDCFGGDAIAYAERYFETVARVVEATGADIIGHFDLVTKFQERERLIDTEDPRYSDAWHYAADELLKTGKPFEINTGAISRGYRTGPYPAPDILSYLKGKGASFILSSDSHNPSTLCYRFNEYRNLL